MARILRRFLYLDPELTDEFLAQLEGGLFSEEALTSTALSGRQLRGRVGGHGVGIEGGRNSGDEDQISRTMRQTAESAFSRLFDALEGSDGFQWLETLDAEIWDQLRRGEIVEVESTLSVSSFIKYANLAEQAAPLLQLMEAIGEAVDEETRTAMTGLRSLGDISTKIPVVAYAAGSPKFKFIASLEREKLRVDIGELEGESTLFAKIQRKLKPSEKYTIFDSIPGLSALPREARREMERDLKKGDTFPDAVVSAPGATVTPIAIYR